MSQALLEARAATRRLHLRRGLGRSPVAFNAVEEVSLSLAPGESHGLVGESGCGKTSVARMLLLLDAPTAGTITFQGTDAAALDAAGLREFRRSVQPVFQDPYSALNPRMRVRGIIAEPLRVNESLSRSVLDARISEALEVVGLQSQDADRHPQEFSGGQRQRIAIARAIASRPRIIILDEPVSSQDVSIRAQILNLLQDLRAQTGVGYLFISHDLSAVRFMCDRVSVMYLGRVVEHADADLLYREPLHPYTQALLASSLPNRPGAGAAQDLPEGEIASAIDPPIGCHFHPRCRFASERCRAELPRLHAPSPERSVACHLYDGQ